MRSRLVLAARAHRLMTEDCRAHRDTETGGILIGKWVAGDMLVPFAVAAGVGAERSSSGFAPDSSFQQPFLDFLFGRFGADYVGDYHRHPGSYDRPSLHDLVTAQRIISDPEWNKQAACFPILTIHGEDVRMRAYLMTRESRAFTEMEVEIVPDTDCRLQAILIGEVPINNQRTEVANGEVSTPGRGRSRFFRRLNWL